MATKERKLEQKKTGFVSWAVFLFSLSITILAVLSVVFPALYMGSMDNDKFFKINIFELGIWAGPFLAVNLVLLTIGILYYKKRLPNQFTRGIQFILNFEISKKVTVILFLVILGIYIPLSAGEVLVEDRWPDYRRYVLGQLEGWSIESAIQKDFQTRSPELTWALGVLSMDLFGNYKVIPFISTISIVIVTYLITVEITKKRFAGIISMVVLLQSGNFLIYDVSITYPTFWVLFHLLSLYFVYKFWPLAPVAFVLALPSKLITAMFLPLNLFFIYRANIPKKRKIALLISFGIITLIGMSVFVMASLELTELVKTTQITGKKQLEFNPQKFWAGFTAFTMQLRFDGLVLLFFLPLTIGLILKSRKGVKQADSILILLAGVIFLYAILPGFSGFTNNPYRYIPFITFFAIGVGVLLSKNPKPS